MRLALVVAVVLLFDVDVDAVTVASLMAVMKTSLFCFNDISRLCSIKQVICFDSLSSQGMTIARMEKKPSWKEVRLFASEEAVVVPVAVALAVVVVVVVVMAPG